MAINRVDYPANLTAQSDFSEHGELIETRFMDQVNAPQWVVSGNIPQGVVLQIGAVVYRADSDTAITGTASDYVKITPDGATASAAYVPDLTGVTWSAQYNGYYHASENLYVFDEGKALAAGEISTVFGRYLMQQANGDVHIGGKVATGSGGGLSEVYPMDQAVRTTDGPTFATVNTGHGANELFAMNQNVRTTDAPTFAGITLGGYLSLRSPGVYVQVTTTPWIVPRGVSTILTGVGWRLEIWDGSTWRAGLEFTGGAVASDGTNVRMVRTSGSNSLFTRRF